MPTDLRVGSQAVDVLQVTDGDALHGAALYTTIAAASGGAVAQAPSMAPTALPGPSVQAVGPAWRIIQALYASPPVALTHAGCEDWVDFLQSENAFPGFRAPLSPTAGAQSYAWPVIFTQPESAILRVAGTSMVGKIEYRPERATFMENNLPSAPGEHWVPLGIVTSPTLICPPGDLVVRPGGNEPWVDLYLDLDATERVLPVYLCYEGQEGPSGAPPAALAAARLAGALGGVGATSFQGEGITCLGPHLERLKQWGDPSSRWTLQGPLFALITPTRTISLHLWVEKNFFDPTAYTITLDYASGLSVGWGLNRDVTGTQRITPGVTPIVLGTSDQFKLFWAIADVPGGTAAPRAGPYTLAVTGTAQDTSRASHVVLMWLGGWVAPPGGKNNTYLPTVLKAAR